ncbi:MAG TPA: patatin-like phospholipase family protein [candidate division Zixibacteria bacterium]|nr:patatin-like phospholipase family protein [candidate division Zixibacteria bacterium]
MNEKTTSPKTAFVFSGGASLGALEAGALKAIVEEGIKPDLVLGTSVGSLTGAMFAFNPTMEAVKIIEKVWLNIKVWNVFSPSPITPVVNFTTSGQYLISPKNLRKLILENIPYTRIEETQVPLYIIGTDIKSGVEVVFDKGLVIEALLSSTCIPGIFPPQHMKGFAVVDGGLLNNTPISTAVRLGAERVIVFPIGVPSPEQEPKNLLEILIRTFIYLLNRQLATDIQLYKNKVDLIIVPPPDSVNVGPHDFSKSKFLMDEGYKKAKEWLRTEGFVSNSNTYSHNCDVHTSQINFLEAIKPDPIKKASTRVKESIKETSKSVKENVVEKADKIYSEIVTKGEEIKEKLERKKSDN